MKEQVSKKLFQEIFSAQEKVRLISQVQAQGIPITARVNKKTEFITKAVNWLPPMRLEVSAPANIKLGLQTLTIQFDYKQERYFSTVDLAFDDWKLFFILSGPLYRLQRRQYQRLRVPAKYKNSVLLMNVNEKVWNEECEVIDLSLGGCSLKLSYQSIDIPLGAYLMFDIKLGDNPPLIQIGKVCYKNLEKFDGKSRVKLGIQFRPHPKYAALLQTVVQNLAADIFSNWSQRKVQ